MKFFLSGILLLLVCISEIKAQTNLFPDLKLAQTIASKLKWEGFQSIDVYQKDSSLIIAYENRVYRFDALGLKRVIQITRENIITNGFFQGNVAFITKRHNVPITRTELSARQLPEETFLENVNTTRAFAKLDKKYEVLKGQNSGNFKAELVLRPFLTMELGNLFIDDNFIHLIDVRPKLNFYLWNGAHFTYEFILPISNEFKTQAPHWSEIRPRVVSFTQQFRLPFTTFLNTSVGLFSRNRYGIAIEISKDFWQSRFRLTGKIGYTGHMSYVRYNGVEVEKGWLYTDLSYLDYKIGGHYWLPKFNTQISIEYGKVLFDQIALFVGLTQKFKEIDLGFYAYQTPEGRNYGFEIGLPLFPKKYWKPKFLSVRPSKRFRYNYLSGRSDARTVVLAREYQAQGMYEEFPQDLNPYFMKNYLTN